MSKYIFIVTVGDIEEGKNIARNLVENKLAACVNIIPNITSIYEWKGVIEEDNEYILFIKTIEEKSDKLIQKIQELHSYDEPECIALKIEKGSQGYLNWIEDVVGK
jgi:periplasmic divalent cation tolerance protein